MGQKIHPTGFRLPVTRAWASRWFATKRNFSDMLAEDLHVRDFLKARLKSARGVAHPDRASGQERAHHHLFGAAGVVIGSRGGTSRNLKTRARQAPGRAGGVNIEEVRKPEIDALAIADSITRQLEAHHVPPRDEARDAERHAPGRAQGIKIMSSRPPERHRDRALRSGTTRRPRAAAPLKADIDWLLRGRRPPTASSASGLGLSATPGAAEAPNAKVRPVKDIGARAGPRPGVSGAPAGLVAAGAQVARAETVRRVPRPTSLPRAARRRRRLR